MEAKIIAIGNSKGVRLPREVLKRCGLVEGQRVRIDVRDHELVIVPQHSPRAGWDEAFRKAGSAKVRENLWGDIPVAESWDR